MVKAIVLLSGGLDSAVLLALALKQGRECLALSFDYGQRHRVELEYAQKMAIHYGINHQIIPLDLSVFKTSSLVSDISVPKNRSKEEISGGKIPSTYVPARNTIFLAFAMGFAELLNAEEIYAGPNALDAVPYPDCTPVFIQAFQRLLNVATKQATEGLSPRLLTPLINWDKAEIIRQGMALNVPLDMTFSCYDPIEKNPCTLCDSCILRADGFASVHRSNVVPMSFFVPVC